MQNEVKSAALGEDELEQEEIPLIGIAGYRVAGAGEETRARESRWLAVWYWPGWKALGAVGQVLLLAGLFVWSGPLIRMADPTAASLDAGIVSVLLLAWLLVDACVVLAWLLVRLLRSTLTEFYEWDVEQGDLKKGISSCLEAKILAGIFSGLVLLFAGLFVVLL